MPRLWMLLLCAASAAAQPLTYRNLEAPFCYVPGGERSWPVLASSLPAGSELRASAPPGGALSVRITSAGLLQVESRDKSDRAMVQVRLDIIQGGSLAQSQTVELRPAPPTRPVTYYADFGDDLINIFTLGAGGPRPQLHHQLREGGAPQGRAGNRTADGLVVYDRAGFDQYFRRLQCQGIAKEILWLMPFPLVTTPEAHGARDWREFVEQGNALIRSPELKDMTLASPEHLSWGWVRDLTAFRLNRAAHQMLSDSAVAHGIQLAVSFRPFEPAVSKYYEIPAFDEDGRFLWFYRPLALPFVNAHPDQAGFAHYRELLRKTGRAAEAEPTTIEFPNVRNADAFLARYRDANDNLRLYASPFAPIQSNSFVLVRRKSGAYDLIRWSAIRPKAEANRRPITGFAIGRNGAAVRLTGVRVPIDAAYITVENPSGEAPLSLDSRAPVRLLNRDNVELGRTAVYFAWPETSDEKKNTRTGGITATGGFNPAFFATEAGVRLAWKGGPSLDLRDSVLVINRGERFSVEMVDYNLPAARNNAVRSIGAILSYPAFRSLYLNLRSHTQLAGHLRDGSDGIQPFPYYDAPRSGSSHLGIDLAYAPLSADIASLPTIDLANFHPGEWSGPCQSPECLHKWRLARNRAVASGIVKLIQDLRSAYPTLPLDVVVPENEAVSRELAAFQRGLPPGAIPHTAGRYNYIQNIGEGVAMADLSKLNVRPVLLGTGAFVSPAALHRYLDLAIAALPPSPRRFAIMFEGQFGLKDEKGRAARELALCAMLARKTAISEVIVYEAADWAYRLPWNGFDFLDRCAASE